MLLFLSQLMGDSESLAFEGQNYGQDLVCGMRMRTCRHLLQETQRNKNALIGKVRSLQGHLSTISKKLKPVQKRLIKGKMFPLAEKLNHFRNLLLSKDVSMGLKMSAFDTERMSRILIGKYFGFKGKKYSQMTKDVGKKLFSFVSSLRAKNISV